jgi:propionyl-CoA carboxylase alpha chain
MFKKILIANRGEIACRVIKSAGAWVSRRCGLLRRRCRAHCMSRWPTKRCTSARRRLQKSYLVIDKIIEAVQADRRRSRAPRLWLPVGERKALPTPWKDEGITLHRPNPFAIEAMGDKISSKKFAADAKVNTVPGYLGEIGDAEGSRQDCR